MAKDFTGINAVKNTIAEATQEAPVAQDVQEVQEAPRKNKPRKTYTAQEAAEFSNSLKTTGRKGVKLPRINLAFTPEVYDYVKSMSKAAGMTYTEFIDKILQQHKAEHEKEYKQILKIRNSL